jgi:hypothetical protein
MRKLGLIAMMTFAGVFATSAQTTPEIVPEKTTELNEVTIVKTKKAVEQKADRTIFNFADQPSINKGSVMEGIKKLPVLIVSDIAGMM